MFCGQGHLALVVSEIARAKRRSRALIFGAVAVASVLAVYFSS